MLWKKEHCEPSPVNGPHEDNMDTTWARMIDHYLNLPEECEYAVWKAKNFPIESGHQ